MAGMDDLVKQAQDLAEKAQELAKDNPEQVKQAVDKIEDMVDKVTDGKYTEHVEKIGDTVADRLTDEGRQRS